MPLRAGPTEWGTPPGFTLIKHLSLFSGIGGLDLAAEWAGFETVAFVEQDKYCQQVLRRHWPGVPIHDDVRTFDGKPFRGVELLTGGFPCQDISCAGKQAGLDGARSGLWFEMLRVIAEARPAFVLGENVANLVTLGLDVVLDGLEDLGYATRAFVVPAAGVGAVHRRMRCFIVAKSDAFGRERRQDDEGFRQTWGDGAARAVAPDAEQERRRPRPGLREVDPLEDGSGFDDGGSTSAHPVCDGTERRGATGVLVSTCPNAEGEAPQRERGGMPAFRPVPTGDWRAWGVEPVIRRTHDGVSRRLDGRIRKQRLRALGNAVVPQQAFPFLEAIAKELG